MCDPTTMMITAGMLGDRVTHVTRVTSGCSSRRSVAAGLDRQQHLGGAGAIGSCTCEHVVEGTERHPPMELVDRNERTS